MNIRPIKNHILFEFVDGVNARGEFEKQKTEAGLWLQGSADDSAKSPRWATVLCVGPDVPTDIKVGEQILIPALRWTLGTKLGEQRLWKTDSKQVVAVRKHEKSAIKPLGEYVIFVRNKSKVQKQGLLFVIREQQPETVSGIVMYTGADVSEELTAGSKIYFNDANFFDTFKHLDVEFSFVKESNILAFLPYVESEE